LALELGQNAAPGLAALLGFPMKLPLSLTAFGSTPLFLGSCAIGFGLFGCGPPFRCAWKPLVLVIRALAVRPVPPDAGNMKPTHAGFVVNAVVVDIVDATPSLVHVVTDAIKRIRAATPVHRRFGLGVSTRASQKRRYKPGFRRLRHQNLTFPPP
jgi:hypothetical protein